MFSNTRFILCNIVMADGFGLPLIFLKRHLNRSLKAVRSFDDKNRFRLNITAYSFFDRSRPVRPPRMAPLRRPRRSFRREPGDEYVTFRVT